MRRLARSTSSGSGATPARAARPPAPNPSSPTARWSSRPAAAHPPPAPFVLVSNIPACSVLALKVIDSSMVSVSPDVDREGVRGAALRRPAPYVRHPGDRIGAPTSNDVKEWMGHPRLSTTMRYVHHRSYHEAAAALERHFAGAAAELDLLLGDAPELEVAAA